MYGIYTRRALLLVAVLASLSACDTSSSPRFERLSSPQDRDESLVEVLATNDLFAGLSDDGDRGLNIDAAVIYAPGTFSRWETDGKRMWQSARATLFGIDVGGAEQWYDFRLKEGGRSADLLGFEAVADGDVTFKLYRIRGVADTSFVYIPAQGLGEVRIGALFVDPLAGIAEIVVAHGKCDSFSASCDVTLRDTEDSRRHVALVTVQGSNLVVRQGESLTPMRTPVLPDGSPLPAYQ